MAYYSDDDILEAVRINMQADQAYRRQLADAVQSKNDSWIRKLVRVALGVIIEIGRAVISAITGWFLPRPSGW
jgi:hypothetical protein